MQIDIYSAGRWYVMERLVVSAAFLYQGTMLIARKKKTIF